MTKRIFSCFLLLALCLSCGPKKKSGQGDRGDNGGFVRFTVEGKAMHDDYFVAQFTPAGDLFDSDNLQLFNYNTGSSKYPQLLMDINYQQSNLKLWKAQSLPTSVLAFSVSPQAPPLQSTGEVKILQVSDQFVQGSFSGELVHPETGKTFPIRGEFKAVLKVNI